jgi:adenylate cyclase
MAVEKTELSKEIEEIWRAYLTTGQVPDHIHAPWYRSKRVSSLYRRLPSNPRCRVCHFPFQGIGGAVMRHAFGIVPSRLNPQLCNDCERFAMDYQGGTEIELSILFADVRGSTQLAENMKPAEFSRLINRYYNAATKVLFKTNAMVEKLIGDAVTGFYTPGLAGPDHAKVAIDAAREILRSTGHDQSQDPWIPVGIGVHTGLAYVGAVNSDDGVADIAVLGDTANIGARLASLAGVGEIFISQATAQSAGLDASGVEIRKLILKGRTEPIEAWILSQ